MTMFGFSKDFWKPVENAGMPQSTKERQETLRAKRAMLGMTEVRGIYLPPDLHAKLKAEARAILKAYEREQAKK